MFWGFGLGCFFSFLKSKGCEHAFQGKALCECVLLPPLPAPPLLAHWVSPEMSRCERLCLNNFHIKSPWGIFWHTCFQQQFQLVWTLRSLLAHAVCSCAQAKSSVLLTQVFGATNWSHWKLRSTPPLPPLFSGSQRIRSLTCFAVQSHKGQCQQVRGGGRGVGRSSWWPWHQLDWQQNWSTGRHEPPLRVREKPASIACLTCWTSRSRQTPCMGFGSWFCMAEEAASCKRFRARSNSLEMDFGLMWSRLLLLQVFNHSSKALQKCTIVILLKQ